MATAKLGKLMIESGQTFFDYTAATDSGDHTVFTVSSKTIFSNKSGYEPSIRPDGIVTGRNIITTHATEETVTTAAFTAYLAGVLTTVSADTALCVRPASGKANINSIILTSAGAVDVLTGTDSTDTTLNETRGSAGGPPLITVGAIELGQVRFTSSTSAVVASSEIFQTVGTHTERFDYPTWSTPIKTLGDGLKATSTAKTNAYIEFSSAIGDPIHVGPTYKKVYVSGYTPIFSEISRAVDFKPAENSTSISSTQIYNGTVGSSSTSLGTGGFTAMLDDGVTDNLVALEEEILTFKFYPNRNNTPFSLTQGVLGAAKTFPVSDQIQATCTIAAEIKTVNFAS